LSDETMLQHDAGDLGSLRDFLSEAAAGGRHLHGPETSVALNGLARGTSLGNRLAALAGRSVLIATGDQLTPALALIGLDGVARRLVLSPPDVPSEHLPAVIADAEVDAVVTAGQVGDSVGDDALAGVDRRVVCGPTIVPMRDVPPARHATE